MSECFDELLSRLAPAFGDPAAWQRTASLWLAGLLNLGRHTVTGTLTTLGEQDRDWSAVYRSLQHLPIEGIFAQVRREALSLADPAKPWVVAIDDSITRKSGRHVPGCSWRKDPLGPAFNLNLVWGQRVLQHSAAIPAGDGSARLVPIDWCEAPTAVRPRKDAGEVAMQAYRECCRQANINAVALGRMRQIRPCTDRTIHWVVDGRFTNRTVLRNLPPQSVLIGRVRKDTKLHELCAPAQGQRGRPRRYGRTHPTPEAMRTDETIPWTTVRAWAAGKQHDFKVKVSGTVLARVTGTQMPVRVVVISALSYRLRLGGKLLYRQPAYLLCTDPGVPVEDILQHYLWRWDIEVNFRDEKHLLGVSQAQLRHREAARRQPAGVAACYALLLLAAHHAYGPNGLPPSVPLPKWRRRQAPRRATTAMLVNQLRIEHWSSSLREECLTHFPNHSPPNQKSRKISTSLASAVFHSLN